MTDVVTLSKEDIEIIWVSFSWDGIPYKGHAWVKGNYCAFIGGPNFDDNGHTEGQGWKFYILEGDNLLYALAVRKLFEDLVYYNKTACSPKPESRDRGSKYFEDEKWKWLREKNKELENKVDGLKYIGEYDEYFEEEKYEEK